MNRQGYEAIRNFSRSRSAQVAQLFENARSKETVVRTLHIVNDVCRESTVRPVALFSNRQSGSGFPDP